MGLAYPLLAAMTPPDWEVEICLETVEDIPFDTDAGVIGIGVMGQAANRGKDIATEFKNRGKIVLMGGPMVSLAPDMATPYCDSVIQGDAEYLWLDVLADIEAGTLKTRYRKPVDAIDTPVPRYDLIMKKPIGDFLPVQAARGCPNACPFCSIYCLYRTKYMRRPLDHIIRDIRAVKALGFKKILLLDDNIAADRELAIELCKAIRKEKITWMSQSVITIGDDPELLKALVESGCTMLSFGLESISPDSLRELNKPWAKPEEYRRLIENISAAGIDVATEMIVGVDSDTRESLEATKYFVEKTRILAPKFYLMTPIPGTDLFNKLQAEGRIVEENLYLITATRPVIKHPNIKTAELAEILWDIYDYLYTIPRILKRTIFQKYFFRSPGRAIFYLAVNLYYRYQIKQRIGPIIM